MLLKLQTSFSRSKGIWYIISYTPTFSIFSEILDSIDHYLFHTLVVVINGKILIPEDSSLCWYFCFQLNLPLITFTYEDDCTSLYIYRESNCVLQFSCVFMNSGYLFWWNCWFVTWVWFCRYVLAFWGEISVHLMSGHGYTEV